ncbi:MAG: hypothetical protein E5V93_14275, partial [Mesorhizobium sp.]
MIASGLKLSRTHRAGQRCLPLRYGECDDGRRSGQDRNADGSIEAGGSTEHGTFDDPWRQARPPSRGRRIGLEREMSTFFYMLLAFVVGILVGWFIWGR